jgi:hypothetical protein
VLCFQLLNGSSLKLPILDLAGLDICSVVSSVNEYEDKINKQNCEECITKI